MKIQDFDRNCQAYILDFLSLEEKVNAASVCKEWKTIFYRDRKWNNCGFYKETYYLLSEFVSERNYDKNFKRRQIVENTVKQVAAAAFVFFVPAIYGLLDEQSTVYSEGMISYSVKKWRKFFSRQVMGPMGETCRVFAFCFFAGPICQTIEPAKSFFLKGYPEWKQGTLEDLDNKADKVKKILDNRGLITCPITDKVPLYPVLAPCGHIHEYFDIIEQIKTTRMCVITQTQMHENDLQIDKEYFLRIRRILQQHERDLHFYTAPK